jgi:hypothetical protein
MAQPVSRSRLGNLSIALLGVALALVSGWHALVMSTRVARPDLALSLNPNEPIALTRLAAGLLAQSERNKQPPSPKVSDYARRSLSAFALNPDALRLLAMSEGVEGAKIDKRLLALSDRVSRRDLGTQMLRIREGAQSGDLQMVLDAYNKALTTKESSWEILFPPLTEILKVPEGRQEFSYFLDKNPPWLSPFFHFALNRIDNPQDYFDILIAGDRLRELDGNAGIQNVLVNSLAAHNRWDMARRAFLYQDRGSSRALISVGVGPETLGNGENTLYWFFPEATGRNAVPIGSRYLSVSAEPGHVGTVAQKILYLAPGTYQLATKMDQSGGQDRIGITWTVQCLSTRSGSASDLTLSRRASDDGLLDTFTVPGNCDALRLLLNASGAASGLTGSELVIEEIALQPVS